MWAVLHSFNKNSMVHCYGLMNDQMASECVLLPLNLASVEIEHACNNFVFTGHVWFGLVWFGLVWFGLVWFGLVWFGLVDSHSQLIVMICIL